MHVSAHVGTLLAGLLSLQWLGSWPAGAHAAAVVEYSKAGPLAPEKRQALLALLRTTRPARTRRLDGSRQLTSLDDDLTSPSSQISTPLSSELRSNPDGSVTDERQPLRVQYQVIDMQASGSDATRKQKYAVQSLLPAVGSFLARSIRVRRLHTLWSR